jgi:hypothetical protein
MNYYELQPETIAKFEEVVNKLAFFTKISFKVIGDSKQKKLISLKRITPAYAYISGYDVLVTINEPLFDSIEADQKAIEVLFVEGLNNVQVNAETGNIKITKADFITCNSVLEKYTPDEVKRVKDIERLALEQAADAAEEVEPVTENSTY